MNIENDVIRILFVCTGNTCRSRMAEGFVNFLGQGKVEAISAGSSPGEKVAEYAVEVMKEGGIDISRQRPKSFESVGDEEFDYVITLCDHAAESCPIFMGRQGEKPIWLHWSIPDPYGKSGDPEEAIKIYRETRDKLALLIMRFLKEALGIKLMTIE
ncbi:MAG: arsenate reductase ArsC [bacterium]